MRVAAIDKPISAQSRITVLSAVALITLNSLSACGDVTLAPEQQLRAWVEQGQIAAESKQRGRLLDMVSPAYVDARGYDRDDIGSLLRAYFLRQNSISLMTSIKDVRVFADSAAEIDMTIGLAGRNDSALGFSATAYHFAFELQREDDDWLLISAQWGRLGEELR